MAQQILVSVKDAAKHVGISPGRLYRLISDGIIPAIRGGKLTFVAREDIWDLEISPEEITSLIKAKLSRRQKESLSNGSRHGHED